MLTETQRRMAATGVTVLDVEVVRLTPDSNPAAYEALFDVGALLGARFVNVLPDDPDLGRLRDSFHILADKARPYGLRPTLEPTAYTSVRSLADAAFVAAGSGGGITIDPLHLHPTSCCCRNSGRWSSPAGPGSRWPGCSRREPGRHDGARRSCSPSRRSTLWRRSPRSRSRPPGGCPRGRRLKGEQGDGPHRCPAGGDAG
jgi:hypothetical protein